MTPGFLRKRERAPQLTIALEAARIAAYTDKEELPFAGGEELLYMDIDPIPSDGPEWPGLSDALAELRAKLPSDTGVVRLAVVLLWPLAETRTIRLPAMRDDERLQILNRGASRYFIEARDPQVVAVAPLMGKYGGSVVASAVSTRLLNAIRRSAASQKFDAEIVQPAEAAWLRAAEEAWPSLSRNGTPARFLVVDDDRVDLIGARRAQLNAIRRFRADSRDSAAIGEALRREGLNRVHALGKPQTILPMREALARNGVTLVQPSSSESMLQSSPLGLAARFGTPDERFRFRTNEALALRQARASRIAAQLFAGAALILILAALVEWWGVRRQLDNVRRERAAIAAAVQERLSGEQQRSYSDRRVDAIIEQYNMVPQWSAAIASLTDELDDDSYLLALRTRGDTILLDGLATSAPAAFAAVERAQGFNAVKAAGEVRFERQEDGSLLERFSIQARVNQFQGGKR